KKMVIVPKKYDAKEVEKKIEVVGEKDPKGKLEWKLRPIESAGGRVVWAQEPAKLVQGTPNPLTQYNRTATADEANTVHLTRVTYTLTAEKAKALESFLKANATAKVLEMKVDGDKLIVTTTPDAQNTIAQVVGLVTGKPVAGAAWSRSYGVEPAKPLAPL